MVQCKVLHKYDLFPPEDTYVYFTYIIPRNDNGVVGEIK